MEGGLGGGSVGGDGIIAGIDPGTTVGIAVVDFDGELVLMTSGKGLGLSGALKILNRAGKIYVIATDKARVPDMVHKVASSLGAVIVSPDEDLETGFKREIARKYKPRNDHERDALAAAIFAYKRLRPRIDKIRDDLREREPEIIGRIIQGELPDKVLPPEEDRKRETLVGELERLRREVEKLRTQVKDLKSRLKLKPKVVRVKGTSKDRIIAESLEERVQELEDERTRLSSQLDKLRRILEGVTSGEIRMFRGSFPSGYVMIDKLGDVYFVRDSSRDRRLGFDDLERIVREYRRIRGKETGQGNDQENHR